MAGILGNAAKFGIGATPTYIASGKNIQWDPGEITLVPSDILNETVPTLSTGTRTNAQITLAVAHDKADTNGQVALNTAWKAGTDVAFTLAPEGSTAGSPKITGNAKVKSMGSMTFEKNTTVMRNVTLTVNGDFTEGVFP
ncbi:MAG: hypothetical protein HGB35_00040 [Geobacteraceae bacterium]|nr:hypothetical protein [Geobacteraceae bacterium]